MCIFKCTAELPRNKKVIPRGGKMKVNWKSIWYLGTTLLPREKGKAVKCLTQYHRRLSFNDHTGIKDEALDHTCVGTGSEMLERQPTQ